MTTYNNSSADNRITVDQILRVLKRVENHGNRWMASCPLAGNHKHGDRTLSLAISVTNGKPLVHCHAGCDQAAVWKAICERVGEPDRSNPEDAAGVITIPEEPKRAFTGTPADVEKFNSALRSPAGLGYLAKRGISVEVAQRLNWGIAPKFKSQDRPALVVPHFRDGELVGIKVRTIDGDKEFYQFPGSTIDGLYAADQLEGGLLSDEVHTYEGPEDTALALSNGFNATGLIAAGSKVSQQDLDTLNQYSRIYLIGDQDSAGQKAMDALQDKLPAEKVIRVRLPGVKDIGDLWKSNPAQFKATLQQYLRLARTSREHFELDDLLTESEVREKQKDVTPYLVDRLIPLQSITMFFGEEKSGKSLLVTYVAKCVVNGQNVFGVLPVSKRPVLYLDLENSSDDIAGMTEHFEGLGPEPIRYKTRLTGCPELDSPGLLGFCEKYKPLVILDSLTKFLRGSDPFHPGEMSELFDKLLNLCAAGATLIIIHHATKADSEKYANSHQIGANVSRGYAVVSEDRPQLHHIRLEPKLCRGAEPETFHLIGFPVIAEHGKFGLAIKIETDADKLVDWMLTHKPDGCRREIIKKEMQGMRTVRKVKAIKEALEEGRLTETEGILAVPKGGNGGKSLLTFPKPGTFGNAGEKIERKSAMVQ